MDQAVAQLLALGTIVLAVSIYIVVFFTKLVVETGIPSLAKKADENDADVTYETEFAKWWNKVILYALPVIYGALIGIFDIPFLFGEDIKTIGGRVLFGIVVGFFSGFFYKALRRIIGKKAGVEVKDLPG